MVSTVPGRTGLCIGQLSITPGRLQMLSLGTQTPILPLAINDYNS